MSALSWQVKFPACLTAQQRATLHAAAEESGIPHQSSGSDAERRITLGGPGQAEVWSYLPQLSPFTSASAREHELALQQAQSMWVEGSPCGSETDLH